MRSHVITAALTASSLLGQGPGGQIPPQQRGPMLLPQAIVMPRGELAVTIDGTVTDWPRLPALRLDDQRQLSGTGLKAWNGPRDLSAMAFMMWDDEHLFFAAQVRDEWHRALDAGALRLSEIPQADSIVLTFDPERNTRSSGPDPGRREDREFWLADEAGRELVQWDRLRGTARVLAAPARSVVLHDKEHGITTYEVRIPWSEILPAGRKPKLRQIVDLQIVINDFDEATDTVPQTRIGWTFGIGPVIDPGMLASMMLVEGEEVLKGQMPEFAPKPPTAGPPLGPAEQWHGLTARLLRHPPAIHDGSVAPEQAGGLQRFAILEEIEDHCERYPRVDYLEFHYRVQRRMAREVAGIRGRGLPMWWDSRLKAVSKLGEDLVPKGTARIFRLPVGGWMVATEKGGFLIDPAGPDVAEWLWGRTGFCVLTHPVDVTRRNDQLLLRMMLGKTPRPVLTHIAFHMPVVPMNKMPLVEPGKACGTFGGVTITALGEKMPDGSVLGSCGYRLEIADGPRMLIVAPSTKVGDIGDAPVDVMLLSPRTADLPLIVKKARPGLVILDDGFVCQPSPSVPRASLRALHIIQKALQPQPSLLLAPGESWDVTRGK